MSDEIFPVRYSQLNPDRIRSEIIDRYGFKETLSCRFFHSGINDTFLIKTDNNNYYLRVSLAGIRNKCDYDEEVSIINTLCLNSIRVAAPVICLDGSFIWEINAPEGQRYAVLFEEAKQVKNDDDIKKTYNLGRMLAQLHIVADENNFKVSRPPIDLIKLAEKPLEIIQPHLAHRVPDYVFLKNAAEELCRYVEHNFNHDKPYYGYCHGDIHCGNVYFEETKPTIFDFDCMGYGWRIYDICVYAWTESFRDEKYIEKEPWSAFLDGYNSLRKLSDIELASINVFAALRELWLIGLHAEFININNSCNWFNDGYFDYHIGIFKLWYNRCELINNTI